MILTVSCLILFIIVIIIVLIFISVHEDKNRDDRCLLPVNVELGIPNGFNFWHPNDIPKTLGYNYILKQPESVVSVISNFMLKFKGITLNDILLGNGSIQLLYAYLYAIKNKIPDAKLYMIDITFFGVKDICDMLDIKITKDVDEADIEYICVINNPDGRIIYPETNAKYKFYDYAYLYDGYHLIDTPYLPYNVDFVFSFSKLGISGLRLGFINLYHSELRDDIEKFIFTSTLGINSISYDYFLSVFKSEDIIHTILDRQKKMMKDRWNIIFRSNFYEDVMNVQGGYILMKKNSDFYKKHNIIGLSIGDLTRLNIMGDNFDCLISQLKMIYSL